MFLAAIDFIEPLKMELIISSLLSGDLGIEGEKGNNGASNGVYNKAGT